jgi:hypothetical protein
MISVVYCTRETNPEHQEHLIKTSGLGKNIEVIELINKGESLTKAYNRGLKQAKYDIVVFCHDDITVETKQWGEKLLKLFKRNTEYGILGVAGTKEMPSSGKWWENPKKMYGRVAHTHEGKTWLSSYSDDLNQNIEETVIVDGVFFAIDKTKIKKPFNEDVNGFHFYELTFCFENYLEGVKVGVSTVIRINHKSIGMTNDEWETNRQQFAETFSDKLPVNIKKVFRKGETMKILIGTLNITSDTAEQEYIFQLIKKLKNENCDITVTSAFDKKSWLLLKQMGVKLFDPKEPPGFKLGDGTWLLKTQQGDIASQPNNLYKIKDVDFDVMYVGKKPMVEHLLRLYPNTEMVCTIHSVDDNLDGPVINEMVTKYIAINEDIKQFLVNVNSIDINKIELYEPIYEPVKIIHKTKLKNGPIKILTGWSDRGGSTNAFIALTNALNSLGYDATLYGPHNWHLDKCKSALLDINNLNFNHDDRLIVHFLQFANRPNVGKVVLACHEKDLYEVGKIRQFWDEVVFLNERHKNYHDEYKGKFAIIPNLKMSFELKDKKGLEKIAGVIGSFDENKQTHISIQRALEDGCEKVYLFGEPHGAYYETYVKPLISEKVILKGFAQDKQSMYDMIGCVYHSSKSEVACLVKDECEATGVIFNGNEATDNPPVLLTNDEIMKEWEKLLGLCKK